MAKLRWIVGLAWTIAAAAAMAFGASSVLGAPVPIDCRLVALESPVPGSVVSGDVEVRGQAQISDLQFYKVEYSLQGRDQWTLIGTDVIRRPGVGGLLVLWQTNTVKDGDYILRLRAVNSSGNYCEVLGGPLTVANQASPTDSAEEPAPTETPVLTAVPPQPTATPRPTVRVEVAPIQNTSGALPTRNSPLDIPGLNMNAMIAFFLFGVLVMFTVMIFLGVVMLLRRFS
jgi:hypothetical protein